MAKMSTILEIVEVVVRLFLLRSGGRDAARNISQLLDKQFETHCKCTLYRMPLLNWCTSASKYVLSLYLYVSDRLFVVRKVTSNTRH